MSENHKTIDAGQWIHALFSVPVKPKGKVTRADFGKEELRGESAVDWMTWLFRFPNVLTRFSDDQLSQGLTALVSDFSCVSMKSLLDERIPWMKRRDAFQSMLQLFSHFFALRCTKQMSHRNAAGLSPLNATCYQWWALFPTRGDSKLPSAAERDAEILGVMTQQLQVDSIACQESALHGLSHWHASYPKKVEAIIVGFVKGLPNIDPALREFSLLAYKGGVK